MKLLRARGLAPAVALPILLTSLVGCRPSTPRAPRQAIVFLLDAARPDRFSCYGYDTKTTPEIDRLAANGVLFKNHFAQGTYTRRSVPSFLFSRYFCMPIFPSSSQVSLTTPSDVFRRPDHEQISFPVALRSAGFKTAAISAHLWISKETRFAGEFDELQDLASRFENRGRAYTSAEVVIDRTIEWIRSHEHDDYLLYVHLMDTHSPHHFNADAQAFFGASTYDRARAHPQYEQMTDDDRRYVNALYDGSLRYADRQIGRVIDDLRSRHLLASTVIAVTADHGEHVLDPPAHKVFRHGGPWLDPVARIPLILHCPNKLHNAAFDGLTEGVDLAPTLLSLLDVTLPPDKSFDGIDLTALMAGRVPPRSSVVERDAIRTNRYKCLFDTGNDVLLGPEPPELGVLQGRLYDLSADPHEMTDLFASRPEVVADLLRRYRSRLSRCYARFQAARSSEPPPSAFAIAARNIETPEPMPTLSLVTFEHGLATARVSMRRGLQVPPDRWKRYGAGSRSVIGALHARQPLSLTIPLPNGGYELSVKMRGRAVIVVSGTERAVSGDSVFKLGPITVTDETFRATIVPKDAPVALSYFGFEPAAAQREDPEVAKKRLDALRSLGYVGD